MKLVVIIPALNEEKTIGAMIEGIPKRIDGIGTIEVVVVNDGSRDSTVEVAEKAGASVVSHSATKGVGAAFRTGLTEALSRGANFIVNIDGDGQFNPKDIPLLLRPVLERKADFVTCSRFKDKSKIPQMPTIKRWGNAWMARIVSFLTKQKFHDVSCGFRAYSKEAALRLNLFGDFTYTQETFLDLAYKQLTILEVPLDVKGERTFGESRVASNVFKYALNTMKIILRTFRDYKPMRFFSLFALFFFMIAAALGIFFIGHYLIAGIFAPHKWAGFVSAFLAAIALMIFVTGLVADMLGRIRSCQEEMLYKEKKKEFGD